METITIQAPNNIMEQIKTFALKFQEVNIQDDFDDEDDRTEAEIAESIAQGVKAIKEGNLKHKGFSNVDDFMKALKQDIQ